MGMVEVDETPRSRADGTASKKHKKCLEMASQRSDLADIDADRVKKTRGIRIRGRIGWNPAKKGLNEALAPPPLAPWIWVF